MLLLLPPSPPTVPALFERPTVPLGTPPSPTPPDPMGAPSPAKSGTLSIGGDYSMQVTYTCGVSTVRFVATVFSDNPEAMVGAKVGGLNTRVFEFPVRQTGNNRYEWTAARQQLMPGGKLIVYTTVPNGNYKARLRNQHWFLPLPTCI